MQAEIESLKLVPWAGKASALIMVIGLKQAKMLGLKYQQNNIVWIDRDVKPKYVALGALLYFLYV